MAQRHDNPAVLANNTDTTAGGWWRALMINIGIAVAYVLSAWGGG